MPSITSCLHYWKDVYKIGLFVYITFCVRNMSSSDVLMTVNITLVYHRITETRHKKSARRNGLMSKGKPSTSRTLDWIDYNRIVKSLQSLQRFERQRRLFCFVYKHDCHEKIIVKTLHENRIIDKKPQLSYIRIL